MIVDQEVAAAAAEDEALPVELVDRFDEPATYGDNQKPVTIRVVGINSKTQSKASAWLRKQNAALGGRKPKPEQEREFWCGYLARCCAGWEGFFDAQGNAIPFTTDTCADVLSKLGFVERQVTAALGNPQRFQPRTAAP